VVKHSSGTGTTTISIPVTTSLSGLQQQSGTLSLTGGGTFSGSGTVPSGTTLGFDGGTFTLNSVTITGAGTTEISSTASTLTWQLPASTTSTVGTPLVFNSGTIAGAGALDLTGNATWKSGAMSGTGTTSVASGATLTVTGTGSYPFLERPLTNDGTIDVVGGGYTFEFTSGSALTNNADGVVDLQGNASLLNDGGGSLTNSGVVQSSGTGTTTISIPVTNAGKLQVANGESLALSSGSTLINTAKGTLGVTVNGTAGGISGPGVTLDSGSTLAVTTVGSPAVGTVFTPISGPVTGTFTDFSFPAAAYTLSYPSGAVELTAGTPFTLSPMAFSPKVNQSTGTVTLANIGSASDGTGTYSATVSWGDGSPTQTASVTISGNTGSVTASHTYTNLGTYTVTTSLANTDGTVQTVTESVTVTGLPTTSVLVPSNGATLSGTTTLDASASNATSVEFRLFGGSYGYNAPVLCTSTPTYYGWVCSWNTTTVPNGSYSLVSEAFGAGGSAFSSGVNITVKN
jgi:hypothetical protein